MPLFRLKISKDVDYCFSVKPEIYMLEKIDEDDSYNHFEGTRLETVKSQEIMLLLNCYEVYNTFENIIEKIETSDFDSSGKAEKTVIFMLNADPRFVGAMVILDEDFDNSIIFMENLENVVPKQREKLEKLNFDKNLKNFYRAVNFPDSLLTESNLKKEFKIVLYEASTTQTINF